MNYSGNYTKTNMQADIKRWQAMFNRFRRRYHTSSNQTERRFLKSEATRVADQLKQWCKRWQNWGFGGYNWITKNYTMTYFGNWPTTGTRQATTCNRNWTSGSYGTKTTSRYGTRRSTTRSNRTRTPYRTGSSAAKTNYVAW